MTLIEAMLVVILCGVVASLVYVSYGKTTEKARINGAWPILRLIDPAARAYFQDNNQTWPADLTILINNGYLDNPNVGQTDWTYSVQVAGANRWAQAQRNPGGRCAGKRLRRYFGGGNAGLENQTLPGCP